MKITPLFSIPCGIATLVFMAQLNLIRPPVTSQTSTSDWHQTIWNDEKAWESTSSGWTAIVSEERSRLVSLAEADHGENLLYVSSKDAMSWGGHLCWLGPQSQWKDNWPPAMDWERSSATAVRASRTLLTVTHPHTDLKYPGLTRSYQWRKGVLHCNLSWQGGYHHAIHIVQVPRWSIIHLHRAITKDFPLGYGMPKFSGPIETLADVAIHGEVGRVDGDRMTLWHANLSEKIAVEPQELIAEIGDHQLKIRRGAESGCTEAAPDHGLLTQVFVGDWQNPFIELEQLSPYANNNSAECEILIEPLRPVR